jgi:hypothetical protein
VSPTATHWRELARRTGKGVEAALLWDESVRRVKVTVSDDRLCHHIDFDVGGAYELSAFAVPFVAAASPLEEGRTHD